MDILSPKELSAKLLGKEIVKVKSSNNEEFMFEIQRVNVEIFAGDGAAKISKIVGKTENEIKEIFVNKFESQEVSKVLSPVLLAGVSSPKVVACTPYNPEKEMLIQTLLTDLELATNLYIEILKISMVKTEEK